MKAFIGAIFATAALGYVKKSSYLPVSESKYTKSYPSLTSSRSTYSPSKYSSSAKYSKSATDKTTVEKKARTYKSQQLSF